MPGCGIVRDSVPSRGARRGRDQAAGAATAPGVEPAGVVPRAAGPSITFRRLEPARRRHAPRSPGGPRRSRRDRTEPRAGLRRRARRGGPPGVTTRWVSPASAARSVERHVMGCREQALVARRGPGRYRKEVEDPAAAVVDADDRQLRAEAARGDQVRRRRGSARAHRSAGRCGRPSPTPRPRPRRPPRRCRWRRGSTRTLASAGSDGKKASTSRIGIDELTQRVSPSASAVPQRPGRPRLDSRDGGKSFGDDPVGCLPGLDPARVRRCRHELHQRRREHAGVCTDHQLGRARRLMPATARIDDDLPASGEPGAQRLGGRRLPEAQDQLGAPFRPRNRDGGAGRRSGRRRVSGREGRSAGPIADRRAAANRVHWRARRPRCGRPRRPRRRRSAPREPDNCSATASISAGSGWRAGWADRVQGRPSGRPPQSAASSGSGAASSGSRSGRFK